MKDDFEDHCWKDVIPPEIIDLYKHYKRDLFIGPRACVLAIDVYEMAYQGGPKPVAEVAKEFPSSCGINAYNAIPRPSAFWPPPAPPACRSSIRPARRVPPPSPAR